jgi:hypothetical protein
MGFRPGSIQLPKKHTRILSLCSAFSRLTASSSGSSWLPWQLQTLIILVSSPPKERTSTSQVTQAKDSELNLLRPDWSAGSHPMPESMPVAKVCINWCGLGMAGLLQPGLESARLKAPWLRIWGRAGFSSDKSRYWWHTDISMAKTTNTHPQLLQGLVFFWWYKHQIFTRDIL